MSNMSIVLTTLSVAAAVLSIIVGGILAYHWMRYSMNATISFITLALYAGVSALLVTLLFAAAAAYSLP